MSQVYECAHCSKPTASRCSRCKLLIICSRECMEKVRKTHKSECKLIQMGRAATPNRGANPETVVSIPLAMRSEDNVTLFAPCERVRERYRDTERRLESGDTTLPTAEKVQFYTDLLQALDTSGTNHDKYTLIQRMALNRQYNGVYREATTQLKPKEVVQLHNEMQRRRIGSYFSQRH